MKSTGMLNNLEHIKSEKAYHKLEAYLETLVDPHVTSIPNGKWKNCQSK